MAATPMDVALMCQAGRMGKNEKPSLISFRFYSGREALSIRILDTHY